MALFGNKNNEKMGKFSSTFHLFQKFQLGRVEFNAHLMVTGQAPIFH